MNSSQDSFIQVYAGDIMETGLIKSLLEDAGITVFLKDEFLGTLAPWWASPGGAGAVKVLVPATDAEKAQQVMEEYRNSESTESES